MRTIKKPDKPTPIAVVGTTADAAVVSKTSQCPSTFTGK